MPDVLFRKPLTLEDMPEMGTASGALDFRSFPVCIRDPLDRSFYLVVEAGPAASGVELVLRSVERGFAPPADIDARLEVSLILSGERYLRPFVNYDLFLFRG